MDLDQIAAIAIKVREKYHQLEKKNGHVWSNQEIMEGFVGDVGDLMKLVMAKEGVVRLTTLTKNSPTSFVIVFGAF